jgi:hypothetical protein
MSFMNTEDFYFTQVTVEPVGKLFRLRLNGRAVGHCLYESAEQAWLDGGARVYRKHEERQREANMGLLGCLLRYATRKLWETRS